MKKYYYLTLFVTAFTTGLAATFVGEHYNAAAGILVAGFSMFVLGAWSVQNDDV